MNSLRALLATIRALPDLPMVFALRTDRWFRDLHRPRNVGTPEAPIACCTMHGRRPVQWPCEDWINADERMARNRLVTRSA